MKEEDALSQRLIEDIANDRADLVELCLALGNTMDYPGAERPAASATVDWLRAAGIEAWLQPISDTSANAVGLLKGSEVGDSVHSLILNAHLDTQGFKPSGGPAVEQKMRGAWLEGELLCGQGLANDKAQLAAEMIAVRALKRAGAPMVGNLYVTGVAQEISAPLDSECRNALGSHGPKFSQIREGFGARWLIDHGVIADYALVAEVSDFTVSVAQAGYLRVRVEVPGVVLYTPAVARGESVADNVNPFERAGHVIQAIEQWCKRYEQEELLEYWGGTIIPKAQINEIQPSGPAWTEPEDACFLFVDIRLVPGANPNRIERSLDRHIKNVTGIECRLRSYDYHRGHIAEGAEHLISALGDAHQRIHGKPIARSGTIVQSMWRDANVFNEVGIKAIGYGPPTQGNLATQYKGSLAGVPRPISVADLVATAQVICLASWSICGGGAKPQDGQP
jgi:acetylornithine deacetylase/succinyl-diaminopimelate desuccinylase-like protein